MPSPTKRPKAKGSGVPEFEPVPAQRRLVADLAGIGTPLDEICLVVVNPRTGKAIDQKTLKKYFNTEITTAKTLKIHAVANNLFKRAISQEKEAVPAAIFWLKTQGRWKEARDDTPTGDEAVASALKEIANRLPV